MLADVCNKYIRGKIPFYFRSIVK